jgi:hypothetical protein
MTSDRDDEVALDRDRPWPGLVAFTEPLREFFFGRAAEADELFRCVRRDTTTLFFGLSGLGKSSLLQAGLFPRLRAEAFLPVLVRLHFEPDAPAYFEQVKSSLRQAVAAAGFSGSPEIGAEQTLWEYFHRTDAGLRDHAKRPVTMVVVFDQFEEVFTLGLGRDESRAEAQRFLTELADLIEDRPSEALERRIEDDPDLAESFDFDSRNYRIVLSLREDYLPSLDAVKVRAPSLGRNRFRLLGLSGAQALDAVLKPADGLVTHEVASEIVRFVGKRKLDDPFGAPAKTSPLAGLEVDPSLLSLFCHELNERRIKAGAPQITLDLLAGNSDEILKNFYEGAFSGEPEALREFVEDQLLTESGVRENVALERARSFLADRDAPPEALERLVQRRLLRIEERFETQRVELIHDRLAGVISRSRAQRRERRRWRKILAAGATAAVVGAFLIVTAATLLWLWLEAQEKEREAVAARKETRIVSRLSRAELLEENDEKRDRLNDLFDWTPPAWKGYLLERRAATYMQAGDLAAARLELNKALRIDSSLAPLLISSSDNFVVTGDGDGAIRDASRAIELGETSAIAYGNLILGEAMRRNYSGAIAHIGDALLSQRKIDNEESLVAEEIRDAMSGATLKIRDRDFLLGLLYTKAVALAMGGGAGFESALDEADRWDRDFPSSREAYLVALNWEWLIIRGQARQDARAAPKADRGVAGTSQTSPPVRDYGAYAVQGALWARIAATRSEFADRATRAFEKFRVAHDAAPQGDRNKYSELAAWVERERNATFAQNPDAPKQEKALNEAREKETRALELRYGPSSGTQPYDIAPAVKLLTNAIRALDPQSPDHARGRREEDMLIRLLLRRGEWTLAGKRDDEKDRGGAAHDARRALAIDPNIAAAHRLLGDALTAPDDRRRKYEEAIRLDPGDADALDRLAKIEEESGSPEKALDLLNRKGKLVRTWSKGYARIAALHSETNRTDRFQDALSNIEKAIELAPWNFDYVHAKHIYEVGAGIDRDVASLHLAQSLREMTEYSARTGDDARALRAYTEAFRTIAGLPENPAVKLELQSVTKSFSTFLVKRFGKADAEQWWRSFGENPMATPREKDLAKAEAKRVAAER